MVLVVEHGFLVAFTYNIENFVPVLFLLMSLFKLLLSVLMFKVKKR